MPSSTAAVASSLVRSQRAMFPAPASVTEATGCVTVTLSVPEPAAPSLSVTVTATVLLPAAAYVWVAVTGLVWLVVLPALGDVPSPQSMEYAHGRSLTPGSLKLALSVTGLPTVADWLAPAFTVGATLLKLTAAPSVPEYGPPGAAVGG